MSMFQGEQLFKFLSKMAAALAAFTLCIQPAHAQSILRDAETEAFFDEISEPLIRASGLNPSNVDIVLINDKSINAFVAGGQTVYLHSGLIHAASTANEVQGVIAHELGHIEGGHVIRYSEGLEKAGSISIASLILAAAAIAAGAGEAGMGIMAAGQQAALGKFLAFSRVQESVADASARATSRRRASQVVVLSTSSKSCKITNSVSVSPRLTVMTAPTRFRANALRCWKTLTRPIQRGTHP